MKMADVKEMAKNWGVCTRIGRTKKSIIQDIQVKEGFSPCFGTREVCEASNCLWMEDCLAKK